VPDQSAQRAAEDQFILDAFIAVCLLFHSDFAPMVDKLRSHLPKLRKLVCLDKPIWRSQPSFKRWLPMSTTSSSSVIP